VAEASQPGETVAQIAPRNNLDGRRVSNWMKKFSLEAALVPVEVTPDGQPSARMQRLSDHIVSFTDYP
jgi:transposase-like protein